MDRDMDKTITTLPNRPIVHVDCGLGTICVSNPNAWLADIHNSDTFCAYYVV